MIHIIMCTYNGEKYVREQLQSIIDNRYSDWKLYISDDQSQDGTSGIVNEYVSRYPDKILFKMHTNPSGIARHFLERIKELSLSMKSDDFIMLCDQDDIWFEDKIALTMEYMNRLVIQNGNEMPLLVCSDTEVVDEKKRTIAKSFRRMNHYSIKKLDFAHLLMENKVQGCTVMINRALAVKLNEMPREISMHDAWLGLIAVTMGRLVYIDEATMAYRLHESNESGCVAFRKIIVEQFKNMNAQKYTVYRQIPQAKEFLRIYGNELENRYRQILEAFISLEEQSLLMKRINIIRYHMWKSGLIRNAGLIVLMGGRRKW